MSSWRCLSVWLAVAALLLLPVTVTVAQAPFPERRGVLANGTDLALSESRINRDFAERLAAPYGLDGLVLLSPDCRPDPEVYLDGALVHYGLAAGAGQLADNAVAWLVCLEPRYVGFFYGAGNPYAERFDEAAITQAMVEDLQAENFTGAVTGGFDAVIGQLEASALAEAAAGGGGPGEGGGGPGSAGAALLLAGAAGLGGAWWWRRSHRRAAAPAAPKGVPGPLAELQAKVADLSRRLTRDSPALARLVLASESRGDEAILELNRRHLAMVERLAELQRQVEALSAGVVPVALRDDEAAAKARYARPLAEADALLAYMDGLDRAADHTEMLLARAPVLAVEAHKAIAAAREGYVAARPERPLPPVDAALAFPTALVEGAQAHLSAGDRLVAGQMAEDAASLAERIAQAAAGLQAGEEAAGRAADLFERIDDFAEANWADIRGNGSEAEESLDAAAELLGRTVGAPPDAFGQDAAAGCMASLERVFDELVRAQALVEAIGERLANLEQAKAESARQLATVEQDIAAARAWIAQADVDPDVDAAPAAALDRAAGVLAEARAAMAGPTPDWLAILRQIQAADQAADAALALARDQHEQLAARRRQVASARQAAEAAGDRMERFLEAHRGDVGAAAIERADQAREALRAAREAEGRAEQLEDRARAAALQQAGGAFDRAANEAAAAYDQAAADFRRAEAQRTVYIPRPSWIGPTVPIPMNARPTFGGLGGWLGGPVLRPPRRSSWGGRPSGGRGFGSRRGGGRGW